MNPILPLEYAAPDVEAHVWEKDPDRVYLYCSNDRIMGGGMPYWQKCFSSEDLIHWDDHGVALNVRKACDWVSPDDLPAVDAIEKDGRYYYYFTAQSDKEDIPLQCVAFSNKPEGPFENAKPIYGTEFPSCGDPCVFVDDDNQAYIFWGQMSLWGAKLKHNMYEIEKDSVHVGILTEEEHGFHEGSSIRKRGDWYYLIYADTTRGMPTCLSYAKSKNIFGPYEKGGVIIDNQRCDREAWNNHGSIFCLNNQWYIAYHRATLGQGACGNRRVCLEPIVFDENGDISEVLMTTQGVEPPLDAVKRIDAFRACEFVWKEKETVEDIVASNFYLDQPLTGWRKRIVENTLHEARMTGVRTAHQIIHDTHHEYLTEFTDGDAAIYRYVDFGSGVKRFRCSACAYLSVTKLEVRLDQIDGPMIGCVEITHTGGWGNDWKEFSCPVGAVNGVHAVYLVARDGHEGHRLCDLDWFVFER